ncbi:MAG: aminotransferase class V-fold PLP-dependent enzyme, partial [Oscillospiraceae bacterium]|nr:aminotransferase class V-fold PLP-dependent enzyme [Oscillospiraceae bacterium]
MEKRFVYVDNAATTPISKEVLDTMMPWLTEGYGNASSIYSKGREAGWALKKAHEDVAAVIGAEPNEVYFTSCGSESDNWALKGAMQTLSKRGKKHIITSVFEHHAILHTCKALEKQGFEVTYLPVYENGIVKPEDVEAAIRPDTGLVSIMFANNEIGTIQPIAEIGKICREHKIWFHTDAVQAMGHVKIDVNELNVDMLSLSGHKIHAQKGIGMLYVRKGVLLPNLIDGGGQERGKRAGTENVAAIMGFAKAMQIANENIEERAARTRKLSDKLIDNILKIEHTRLNGDREKRLPGNVNISIEGIEGESLLLSLDMLGICASSGSACTSGSL